jgi:hypothetical protein
MAVESNIMFKLPSSLNVLEGIKQDQGIVMELKFKSLNSDDLLR